MDKSECKIGTFEISNFRDILDTSSCWWSQCLWLENCRGTSLYKACYSSHCQSIIRCNTMLSNMILESMKSKWVFGVPFDFEMKSYLIWYFFILPLLLHLVDFGFFSEVILCSIRFYYGKYLISWSLTLEYWWFVCRIFVGMMWALVNTGGRFFW